MKHLIKFGLCGLIVTPGFAAGQVPSNTNDSDLSNQADAVSQETRRDAAKIQKQILHEYVGVGIILDEESSLPTAVGTMPNSPAEAAGILAGDVVVAVDGELVKDRESARSRIKEGARGSTVAIDVIRNAGTPSQTQLRFNLTRDIIRIEVTQIAVGQEAPDFTAKSLNGKQVSLKQYKGKPILLYFWTTWCPYCRMSAPLIKGLANNYASDGLVVLGIDGGEGKGKVGAYVQQSQAFPYTVLLDRSGYIGDIYGRTAIPRFVLIGPDGKIAAIPKDPNSIEHEVNKILSH